MEGLGSPKAMPNLDIKSKGPNYTTIIPYSILLKITKPS